MKKMEDSVLTRMGFDIYFKDADYLDIKTVEGKGGLRCFISAPCALENDETCCKLT